MKALLPFLPLFARLQRPLLLALALSLLTLAAGIGLLGISGWFLTAAALSTAGAAFNLFAPSAGVRGLSFTRILSRYGEKVTGHDATLKLLSDLRRWTFAQLFRLVPLGRHFGRADIISRLVADLDALDSVFLVALGPMTTAIVAGIGMTVLLGFMLPFAAPLYAAGFAVAVIGVPLALVAATRKTAADAVSASAALRRVALDSIDGHQDLVLFDAVATARVRLQASAARLAAARHRLNVMSGIASAAVQLIAAFILLSTLVIGIAQIDSGAIDGPVFVGLLLAVLASFEVTAMLVRSAGKLATAIAAAERLNAIADAPVDIVDPPQPQPLPPGGELVFDHVSFGYGGRQQVITGLSFRVAGGDCVAIKGPSGSGKSTVAQLAVRLVDPTAGAVLINGRDLRTASSADLRDHIALMTQDAPVFNDTVRANLRLGRPEASDEMLWAALDRVDLAKLVRDLPEGLDAVLGEAGSTLSTGQARRICLARTLLSPAGILILDEPTSGLDPRAEAEFLEDLPRIKGDRTVVVVTHAEVPEGSFRVLQLRGGRLAHDQQTSERPADRRPVPAGA